MTRTLFSSTTRMWFSFGILAVSRCSILLVMCWGDVGVNLSKIKPLALSLSLNMSLPKSLSKVIRILSFLLAKFSTSLSVRPRENSVTEIMSMPFLFRVFTVLFGMFSSARSLVKAVGKPSLLLRFLLRILGLLLCLPS